MAIWASLIIAWVILTKRCVITSFAITLAKEVGNRAEEGRAYCSIACVYRSMGNFKEAINYYQEDLRVAEEVGGRAQVGRACSRLGRVFQSIGDFKRAIEYHNLYLSIAKELGNLAGEGTGYLNFGRAHQSLSRIFTRSHRANLPKKS